jgi:hypothetical protein
MNLTSHDVAAILAFLMVVVAHILMDSGVL